MDRLGLGSVNDGARALRRAKVCWSSEKGGRAALSVQSLRDSAAATSVGCPALRRRFRNDDGLGVVAVCSEGGCASKKFRNDVVFLTSSVPPRRLGRVESVARGDHRRACERIPLRHRSNLQRKKQHRHSGIFRVADLGPGTMPRGKYPESPAPAGSHTLISRTPTPGGMLHANLGLPRPPPRNFQPPLPQQPPKQTQQRRHNVPPVQSLRGTAQPQRRWEAPPGKQHRHSGIFRVADLGPGTMPRGKYPESPAPAGSHALISRTPTPGGMLHANLGLPRPPPRNFQPPLPQQPPKQTQQRRHNVPPVQSLRDSAAATPVGCAAWRRRFRIFSFRLREMMSGMTMVLALLPFVLRGFAGGRS